MTSFVKLMLFLGLDVLIGYGSGVQAQELFSVTAEGGFIPTTGLHGPTTGFSTEQATLELSVLTLTMGYSLTSFTLDGDNAIDGLFSITYNL
jgi:hypothetical protein